MSIVNSEWIAASIEASMEANLRIIVFASLAFLGLQLCYLGLRTRMSLIGKPPIPWPLFGLAKAALAASLFLLLREAWSGRVGISAFPIIAFLFFLLGGTLTLTVAFSTLGKSLCMGLSNERTVLVTWGIYRLSRNPIYLGIYCLLVASLLYAFSWLNLATVIVTVVLHHRIILAEESHLRRQFPEYETYCKSVPRYL